MGLLNLIGRKALGKSRQADSPQRKDFRDKIGGLENLQDVVVLAREVWLGEGDSSLRNSRIKALVDVISKRFPQEESLARIMLRIYGDEQVNADESGLRSYAESLAKTREYGVEGQRYLCRYFFAAKNPFRGVASSFRSVLEGRDVSPVLKWNLLNLLKDFSLLTRQEADKDLPRQDKAAGLALSAGLMASATLVADEPFFSGLDFMSRVYRHSSVRTRFKQLYDFSSNCAKLAQRDCIRHCGDVGFALRLERCLNGKLPDDHIQFLRDLVLSLRVEDAGPGFKELEIRAHVSRLKGLNVFLDNLRRVYDFPPLLEMDAELALRDGDPGRAADIMISLYNRFSEKTFYAYQAFVALENAGRKEQARAYLVHAARTPGAGLRSRLARVEAVARAYALESQLLRTMSGPQRARAALALASFMGQRGLEAYNDRYVNASYAFMEKAVALSRLAVEQAAEAEIRIKAQEETRKLALYTEVIHDQALSDIEDIVFSPLSIPFAITNA